MGHIYEEEVILFMFRNKVPRETRICAHSDCSNTFECKVNSSRKFCCTSCVTRGRKRSAEAKENYRKAQTKKWQDPEYVQMQHEARMGRAGWNRGLTKETHPSLAAQSKKVSGENNVRWRGGVGNFPYPFEFTDKLKESVRKRDNNICQSCGKTRVVVKKECGKDINIHHIDYNKQNCTSENLITLCGSCNSKVNTNREHWEKFFKDVLQEKVLVF